MKKRSTPYLIWFAVLLMVMLAIIVVWQTLPRQRLYRQLYAGQRCLNEARYDDAIMMFMQAAAIDGNSFETWLYLGDACALKAGTEQEKAGTEVQQESEVYYDRAVQAYQNAAVTAPGAAEPYERLIAVYARQAETAESAEAKTQFEQKKEETERFLKEITDGFQ